MAGQFVPHMVTPVTSGGGGAVFGVRTVLYNLVQYDLTVLASSSVES